MEWSEVINDTTPQNLPRTEQIRQTANESSLKQKQHSSESANQTDRQGKS